MSKKSVHKLSPIDDESTVLFGISSHENDYRLSWALNQYLNYNFVKTDNLTIYNQSTDAHLEFTVYKYQNEDDISFRLISNRCDNGYLLEKLKNIDFILIVEPFTSGKFNSELQQKIKGVPLISAVFPLNSGDKALKKLL
jgi:hypothetical protein